MIYLFSSIPAFAAWTFLVYQIGRGRGISQAFRVHDQAEARRAVKSAIGRADQQPEYMPFEPPSVK